MMKVKERLGYRGSFRFQLHDAASGKLVRDYASHNLVVDGAKGVMAHLIGGDSGACAVAKIACGVNGAETDPADAEITEAFVKEISGVSYPESDQVQFDWHLADDEYNGKAIKEFGLLTEDEALFARIVLDEPLPKTPQFSIDVQWAVIFNNGEDDGEESGGGTD
jgi:hypothetical protein